MAPSPTPSLPPQNRPGSPRGSEGAVGSPLGFRVSHIRHQGPVYFVRNSARMHAEMQTQSQLLKFTKDACRDADAVPAPWVPSPWSRRKSVSSITWERGSLSEGSSLPIPSPGFPAPIPPPSTSSWPAAEGGAPRQERSLLHLQEPAKRL